MKNLKIVFGLIAAAFVGTLHANYTLPVLSPNPESSDTYKHVGVVYAGYSGGFDLGDGSTALLANSVGSGTAVGKNTILTCAHVCYHAPEVKTTNNVDPTTDWYFLPAREIWWEAARDDPYVVSFGYEIDNPTEHIKQINGFEVLTFYSARRITAADSQATDWNRDMVWNSDAAVLWAFRDIDPNGGAEFYADGKEALESNRAKILAGYPAGEFPKESDPPDPNYTLIWQPEGGKFYATPSDDYDFEQKWESSGNPDDPVLGGWGTYITDEILTTGGNSGGPIFVENETGGGYRVAGVVVGASTDEGPLGGVRTIYRVIDDDVIELINYAKVLASWDYSYNPTVTLVNPSDGDTLSGVDVTLDVTTSDDDVAKVIFSGSSNGTDWTLIDEDTFPYDSPPYDSHGTWSCKFDTSSILYMVNYRIKAEAIDYFGNKSAPSISVVTINNRADPDYLLEVVGGPLSFEGIAPEGKATLSYTVKNRGKKAVDWEASETASWISSVTPSSRNIAAGGYQTVTVEVDASGLSLGENKSATITNSSTQVTVSNVSVSMSVAAGGGDGEIVIHASADTFVDEHYRASNWGGYSTMSIGYDSSSQEREWSMLQFDPVGLGNKNIKVTKATLKIYCDSIGGTGGTEDINVHAPSNNWVEGIATGQSAQDPDDGVRWMDVVTDPGAVYDSRGKDDFTISSTGWQEVDVTTWAKWTLDGGSSSRASDFEKGMLLRYHGTPDAYHRFKTKEGGYTASITVEYVEKDGVDPTVAITSHSDGESVSSANISISGTAYDASGIDRVQVNNDDASSSDNWATWSKSVTLSPGANTITIEARDKTYQSMDDIVITLHYNPPTLAIFTDPESVTVEQGQSGAVAVLVSGTNGFDSSVSLSTSNVPANVSTSFDASAVTASGSTNLTFDVASNATIGKTNITVSGAGGGKNDSTTIELNVVAPPSYAISTSSEPAEGGTVTPGDTYVRGDPVSLTATKNTGYKFVNWKENGSYVSDDNPYEFTAVKARTLVAVFELAGAVPDTPTNTSPTNLATDVELTPSLVASAFSDTDSDTHQKSEWKVYSDSSLSIVVWSGLVTTGDLTTVSIPVDTLELATDYYWQVRYQDDKDGWSDWSVATMFSTKAAAPFVLTVRDETGGIPALSATRLKLVRWLGIPGSGGVPDATRDANAQGEFEIDLTEFVNGQTYVYSIYYERPNAFDPVGAPLGEFWGAVTQAFSTGDQALAVTRSSPHADGAIRFYAGGQLLESTSDVSVGTEVTWEFDVDNSSGAALDGSFDLLVDADKAKDGSDAYDFEVTETKQFAIGKTTVTGAFTVTEAAIYYAAVRINVNGNGKTDARSWSDSMFSSSSQTTTTLPSIEGFEAGLGVWNASAGYDFDWTRKTGATASSNTGPSAAAEGSYYLYTEASSNFNKTAAIEATFNFTGITQPELKFSYHMYGANMGSLSVDVFDGTWHNDVWSKTGQQHASDTEAWSQAQVGLSAYAGKDNVKLRIRGLTGSAYTSDIAIDDVRVNGLLTYVISGGVVTITGCDTVTTGIVNIPATIEGKPVTSIGDDAFANCDQITGVTIPDSVTTIGARVFWHCYELRQIVIPEGVTTMGERSFVACSKLESVSLPDSLTTIADYAFFYDCGKLASVKLPAGLTGIGQFMFYGCSSLEQITLGTSIASIGNYAFWNCSLLSRVEFIGDAPSVGTGVFGNTAQDFSVYYWPSSSGFTSPTWQGYPAQLIATTAIIGLSGDMAFGNVEINKTKTSNLTIGNTGNSALEVTSISYPIGFSGDWSGSIAPGSTQQVSVTFSPTAVQSYSGTITVNSNKTSGGNTRDASGRGFDPSPVTETLSLAAIEDTAVSQENPNTNYGSGPNLGVGPFGFGVWEILVKFDLNSLPDNAVVTSAQLIFEKNDGAVIDDSFGIAEPVFSWDEHTANWSNTDFSITLETVQVSEQADPFPPFSGPPNMTMPLGAQSVSYIQGEVDGTAADISFMISTDLFSGGFYIFQSREAGNAPRLLIEYQIPSSDPYDTAVADAGLTGANALPSATPFKDGVSNLLKFAFNMNLAGSDTKMMAKNATSGLPTTYPAINSGGQPVWRVEYIRRKGSYLSYTPQKSIDMVNFSQMSGTPLVSSIDSVWERVTIDEPFDPSSTPKLFTRVLVTKP